jgi:ABC-type oligopeptide transport system substrate-binding subunit
MGRTDARRRRTRALLVVLAVLAVILCSASAASAFKTGAASTDVTPPPFTAATEYVQWATTRTDASTTASYGTFADICRS